MSESMPSFPQPPVTLAELVRYLPDATLVGDGSVTIRQVVHPLEFSGPQDIVLVLDSAAVGLFKAGLPLQAAIVADGIPVPEGVLKGYITVKRPRVALVNLLRIFDKPLCSRLGIHPTALIEEGAQVDASASIGPFAYVGPQAVVGAGTVVMSHVTIGAGAKVGENCLFHSGARIGERVVIGHRVIIQHNASIGADGFSFVTPEPGSIETAKATGGKVTAQNTELLRINSIGTVVLEDDVEVGACAAIDRANLGATLIKRGTKIDNLVMIGHNNTVGENCLIVSQAGVAGSCKIGNRVVVAGQVGIADHLKIGDDAIIMAQSGVMRDVEPRSVLMGIPAAPQREFFKQAAYIGRLREAFSELKALRREMEDLKQQLKEKTPV